MVFSLACFGFAGSKHDKNLNLFWKFPRFSKKFIRLGARTFKIWKCDYMIRSSSDINHTNLSSISPEKTKLTPSSFTSAGVIAHNSKVGGTKAEDIPRLEEYECAWSEVETMTFWVHNLELHLILCPPEFFSRFSETIICRCKVAKKYDIKIHTLDLLLISSMKQVVRETLILVYV